MVRDPIEILLGPLHIGPVSFPTIVGVGNGVVMSGVVSRNRRVVLELANDGGLLVDLQVGEYRDTFTVEGLRLTLAPDPRYSYICMSDRSLRSQSGSTVTFQ